MRPLSIGVAVGLSILALGCGSDDDSSGTTELSAALPSSTTAGASTTTTVPDMVQPDGVPFSAGEPVDLLVLTDSSGWGLADRYASFAAEALGREVRVHDRAQGGAPITDILDQVQTSLADEVAEAEIIVIYGFPGGLEYDLPEPSILNCFEAVDAVLWPEEYSGDWTPGSAWEPIPVVATVEDWQPYRDVLDQVYDEIWKLRDGQPTIIRTYDIPVGYLAPWKQLGIDSECIANMMVMGQVIRDAAEANGAGFVSTFDVFNGPNHDEDPVAKGLMDDDLLHANEAGRDIIAELLAAYGFDVSQSPR
jgi:hypothetical protein